jgi:hypothetical protein
MPDDVKLNNAIDFFADTALGSDSSGNLSRERALAIDAYGGRNIDPAPSGCSQVVDWTVFETIQWILPSLTRIFAGGSNVVEFEPFGPEDEVVAKQESDILNHKIVSQNNWFLTCLTWFQDALLTKNAYCMASIDESEIVEKETYLNQSDEAIALLMQEGAEILEAQENITMEGMRTTDVVVRRTRPRSRLCFDVLPPERCLVAADAPDFTTENTNYFEYWEEMPISDLRAMGFDVPDDIASELDEDTEEETSRNLFEEHLRDDTSVDPSMRKVKVRTIWIRFDYDEDGIAELQKVIRVGQEILFREEVSRIPVASIVPFINTHRHMGNSVADLTFDLQRIKTALLRGGLDSVYLSMNPRHVISNKVNLDDMLVSRSGGVVRLEQGALPSDGHVLPLQTEFTLPQTLEGLRHMDSVIEARVGVNRIFQGIDEGQLNDHDRIGQLSTMAAQRVEQIARIFSSGVSYLFSIAHELLIKSGHAGETVRLRGQWVQVDPSSWRTGRDLRVVAPFAAGNKDMLVTRLLTLAQLQEKALTAQLPIVTPQDAYNTMIELTKASDITAPDKFWTDPSTIPPPEPEPDYTMMALEIENKKADNQASDSQIDAEVKLREVELDAEIDKYRADLQAEVQLIVAQLNAGAKIDLESAKARLRDAPILENNEALAGNNALVKAQEDAVRTLTEAVKELQATAGAEREVVRDKAGKVVGVKINGQLKKVKRENGKIVGL